VPAIVDGNAARLEQVMINLLLNAVQALDVTRLDNEVVVEIAVGDRVTITVADTGPGLAEPERVFEPFFTTKPAGEGTGLGLSVCKQLVEAMHGRIEIANTSARGTQIAVTLPRRTVPVASVVAASEPVRGARMRILVIDDEPQVCAAMQDLLSSEHDVETAVTGEQALAMFAATDHDVVLCDVMMPRMNGRDVYEQIRTRWPGHERRVVFVTGGAFIPAIATFLESVDNQKLRKPFTAEGLLAVVRAAQQRAAS
jgi:CheY-like chemotaxis protein/anti-sigma regulatory factor (Ser/Thr protein kinase)